MVRLRRRFPKIEAAVLRVFDRSQDTALALPAEQRACPTGEQLQQRRVGCIQPALGHDVSGEFLGCHWPRCVTERVQSRTRKSPRKARAPLSEAFGGCPRHRNSDRKSG